MAIQIPSQIRAWAEQAAPSAQIRDALIAISYYESSWNPGAEGDWTVDGRSFFTKSEAPPGAYPTSFGLTQLHTGGGLGDGYARSQLLDPVSNYRIAATNIQGAMAGGATLYAALGPWATRDLAWGFLQEIGKSSDASPPAAPANPVPNAPGSPSSANPSGPTDVGQAVGDVAGAPVQALVAFAKAHPVGTAALGFAALWIFSEL